MTIESIGVAVRAEDAERWVLDSLNEGTSLAQTVAETLWKPAVARLLLPSDAGDVCVPAFDHGRGLSTTVADQIAVDFFSWAEERGCKTLLVESDLARRGDRNLDSDVVYVGNRVLRWVELAGSLGEAVQLLRRGSSGYPLNAFACSRRPAEFDLVGGQDIADSSQALVVESAQVVIVSAFDAETFLTWSRPKLSLNSCR